MGVLSACGFVILLLERRENSEHLPSLNELAVLAVASVVILTVLAIAPPAQPSSWSSGHRPNVLGIGVLTAIGLIAGSQGTAISSSLDISKPVLYLVLLVALAGLAVVISRLSKGKGPR